MSPLPPFIRGTRRGRKKAVGPLPLLSSGVFEFVCVFVRPLEFANRLAVALAVWSS